MPPAGTSSAGDARAFSTAVDRWLAYYDGEGVTAIGFRAIVLRRGDTDPDPRARPSATSACGTTRVAPVGRDRQSAARGSQGRTPRAGRGASTRSGSPLSHRVQLASVRMSLEEGVGTVAQIVRGRCHPLALDDASSVGRRLPALTRKMPPLQRRRSASCTTSACSSGRRGRLGALRHDRRLRPRDL